MSISWGVEHGAESKVKAMLQEMSAQGNFIASGIAILHGKLQNHEWEEKEYFEWTKNS